MGGSRTDSTASTPQNDDVKSIIKNDRVRYQRKGYGLIFACLLHVSFFFILPQIVYALYPTFTEENTKLLYGFLVVFIHSGMYTIVNLGMWAIYKLKWDFFERYKIMDKPWPWEEDDKKWREMLKKTMKVLVLNLFVLTPAVQFIDIYALNGLTARLDIQSFPTTFEIIWQVSIFMVLEDTMFYWAHRLFHHQKIYRYIHKQHHEYSNSVSICAEYAHPIEFIVANLLPSGLCYKVLGNRVHFATIIVWFVMRIAETCDGHCGYEFSWSPFRLLPLSGSSEYHNFHHSKNSGNYGSFFSWWDTLCQTNKAYFQFKSKKENEQALNLMRREFDQNQIKSN